MKPEVVASEGIYYVVRFPGEWQLRTYRYAEHPQLDHVHFWEQILAEGVARSWAPVRDIPSGELLNDLRPLTYAFPRGRVSRVKRTFLVLHGNDLEPFMKIKRRQIEVAFGIAGKCRWSEDEHEHCQLPDQTRMRVMLSIGECWQSKF